MTKYFHVLCSDDYEKKEYGVAYSVKDSDPDILPKGGNWVDNWEDIVYKLEDGGSADYLADDLGARLCSERLRGVVDENKSETDKIQWLRAMVLDAEDQKREYYILHFPEDFPIVNKNKSLISGQTIIKPVLDIKVIRGHNIARIPISSIHGGRYFVSDTLRKAIKKAKITGIGFLQVPLA